MNITMLIASIMATTFVVWMAIDTIRTPFNAKYQFRAVFMQAVLASISTIDIVRGLGMDSEMLGNIWEIMSLFFIFLMARFFHDLNRNWKNK